MKRLLIALLAIGFLTAIVDAAEKQALKDQKDKISYSLGADIGNSLKRQSIEINPDALVLGLRDVLSNSKTLLTDKEMQEILAGFRKEMMAKQAEQFKAMSEKNKREGEAFLAENKRKDGVITLPSGLQYKVIKAGTGAVPKETDTVVVHYTGTLINGNEFDSSYKRGEPASFSVNGIIQGWKEALLMMKTGSKWQLFIPSSLAYGERGAGRDIGPNSALIFEVELVSIK
ncbi:MAG: FKBP-type peptidyl-prolyl cis-trans isomerase [Nitrospirota bacterium]